MFTSTELMILKNFSGVNTSQVIYPDRFEAVNNSNSVIASFKFDHDAYDFKPFGIYDLGEFLSALQALKEPTMDVKPKFLTMRTGEDQIKYFTSPLEVLPEVPLENLDRNFGSLECEIDFSLSADKLAMIFKMASVLKTEYVFIECDDGNIRITVADELESSNNMYEVMVTSGVTVANCEDGAIKIPLCDLQLLGGDYNVKISTKKISLWENMNGVSYYIGCSVI